MINEMIGGQVEHYQQMRHPRNKEEGTAHLDVEPSPRTIEEKGLCMVKG